jgi:integrase
MDPTFEPKFHAGRNKPWTVRVPKRLLDQGVSQKFFTSKRQAQNHAALLKKMWLEAEPETESLASLLPPGVDLRTIVKDYVRRNNPAATKSVGEAFDAFVASRPNRRPRTIETYRQARALWVERLSDCSLASITPQALQEVLDSLPFNTARLRLSTIKAVLNWASSPARGWILDNPANACELPEQSMREISVLTVDQCRSLLTHGGEMVPYYALGLFTGGRPSELERVMWEDICEDNVRLTATKSRKVSRQRFIPVTENFSRHLAPFRGTFKPAPFSLMRRHRQVWQRLKSLPEWQGVDSWPQDCVRHTFASYWLAMHHDQGRLQYLLGHRSGDMIHDHYLAAVTSSSAEEFWSL